MGSSRHRDNTGPGSSCGVPIFWLGDKSLLRPDSAPRENLDFTKLARLNVRDANIRHIAMNTAFLAADAGENIRLTHLLAAARSEDGKLERPLAERET
jgi:hypothetical protein